MKKTLRLLSLTITFFIHQILSGQVTLTNVNGTASFMTQVNAVYPGAVTFASGTYTLANFVPQITINGYFYVNENLTINNCQLITFGTDAVLSVTLPSCTLYVESSTLKASGTNMWQGILGDNTYLGVRGALIKVYNSTIKDARIGLHVLPSNNLADYIFYDVYNSTFDKCYIGIEGDYGQSTIKSAGKIKKTSFTCTSTLLAPFANQYTTAGIVADGCSYLEIGDPVETNIANFNVFDGIACGVFSYWATLNVYSSNFNNIRSKVTTLIATSPLQEDYNGSAIYQRGIYPSIIFGPPDPTQPDQFASNTVTINSTCRFYNCFEGADLRNTHITVNGATMSNMDYGILVQNCNTATVNILNSTMDLVKYGITATVNNNSNIVISTNTIGLPNPYGAPFPNGYYGVKAIDWPSYNAHFGIAYNYITSGCIGVRMENTNSTSSIYRNTISQVAINTAAVFTVNIYGIQTVNTNGSSVTENRLYGYTGAWNTLYHQTGIYLSNSLDQLVRCNQIQNTGYGIWATGNNTAVDKLENNTLLNHRYGLYESKLVSAYAKVGDQGGSADFNGNEFNGLYTGTYKTFNLTDASQNALTTDIFWYDPAHSSMYTTNFSSSSPTGKPVRVQPILGSYTTPTSCPVFFMMQAPALQSSATLGFDEALAIAEEQKTYTDFPEVSKWFDERTLYSELEENPSAMQSETTLENFYDEKSDESVGKLKDYNNTLAELSVAPDSVTYAQKLGEAKQKNAAIPATHKYEQNEKAMNEIFLNNIATQGIDLFDSQQTNLIRNLAQACPYVEGKAVYLARVLYSLIEPSVIFDDESICANGGYYKKEQEEAVEDQAVKFAYITPNPANNKAQLFLNLEVQEAGKLQLTDLLGNVVLKYDIISDKTVQEINLESINSGTYFYSVQTANGFTNTGRLVVIK
jgi:hypothetical protein